MSGRLPEPDAESAPTQPGPVKDLPIPHDSVPVERSPRDEQPVDRPPAGIDGAPGSAALAAFIGFHPFMAFFIWLAKLQSPDTATDAARVAQYRAECRRLYWTCVASDFIVTAIAVLGVLALAGVVAYKSLLL